jgi:hypothetical protein
LICSQLPADTTYPLDISLRVLPPPDGQQGQWAARVNEHRRSWRVVLPATHPLSAYEGRSISKVSLSHDKQLTLTFAPAAPSAAAIARVSTHSTPPETPQQPQSRKSLKWRAPTGSRQQQQQPVTDAQVPGSNLSAASAASAAGGSSTLVAAAGRNKPTKTKRQQQQAAALDTLLASGTEAAAVSLPPSAILPDASSPADIECELVGLMTGTLLPLLPRQTYVDLMRQLRELFAALEQGGAGAAAGQLRRLRCKYAYVRAAVYGGQLGEVVAALRGLS